MNQPRARISDTGIQPIGAPRDDARFRGWRAEAIEKSRERHLEAEDLFIVMPFRRALLTLAKKHGLTVTCAILERSL
jgi:hypothetical protein